VGVGVRVGALGPVVAAVFAAAFLIAVSAPAAPASQEVTWPQPAAPEIQAFVRSALDDRLRANDIPDLKLLQGSRHISVRNVMPRAQRSLSESALPQIEGYDVVLVSPAEAQATADRRNETVEFITVDDAIVGPSTATIEIGVDRAVPRTSGLIKLCCCTGQAEFRRSAGGWAFVKWASIVCS
jgi:hypothetical protein